MDTTFIYGLFDPRTNELRYIGKSNNPKTRYNGHIYKAIHILSETNHVLNWIRKLLSQGKQPKLVVLEEVSSNEWQEAERWWIKLCRSLGYNLTNITEGGDAPEMTEESIKKMSESKKGKKHTEESKKKIGLKSIGRKNWLGKTHSEETKRKISETKKGTKLTEEHIRKVVEKLRGRSVSEETRKKIAKSNSNTNKGRKLTEEHKRKISEGLQKGGIEKIKQSKAKNPYRATPETREKLSKAIKASWKRRKIANG